MSGLNTTNKLYLSASTSYFKPTSTTETKRDQIPTASMHTFLPTIYEERIIKEVKTAITEMKTKNNESALLNKLRNNIYDIINQINNFMGYCSSKNNPVISGLCRKLEHKIDKLLNILSYDALKENINMQNTVLQVYSILWIKQNKQLNCLETLKEIVTPKKFNEVIFYYACYFGNLEKAINILSEAKDISFFATNLAFIKACEFGYLDIVKLLVSIRKKNMKKISENLRDLENKLNALKEQYQSESFKNDRYYQEEKEIQKLVPYYVIREKTINNGIKKACDCQKWDLVYYLISLDEISQESITYVLTEAKFHAEYNPSFLDIGNLLKEKSKKK